MLIAGDNVSARTRPRSGVRAALRDGRGAPRTREVLAAGVSIRFFDTVLRAYCTFDTVEASVIDSRHDVRIPRKLVLTECNVVLRVRTQH